MKGIIDRFEGKFAIIELEDRKIIKVEARYIPEACNEGDCIYKLNDIWHLDTEGTEMRKKRLAELMDDVFE